VGFIDGVKLNQKRS